LIRIMAEGAAPSTDGERKLVTALFADIKGSMELIEDLDPEEASAIVDPALKLMMEAVQRYGGYVAQSTGDGIFALFGAPLAHEDHPQRALYAALRMQEELKRYSDRIRAEGRLPIQARVGVNTGEVVVRSISTGEGRTEYAPVGHSTGIAARMQALAPVGSIAATDQVRKLCEGYFVFKSLGPTRVKGVSEPVTVYEVTGLGPLRTRLQRAAARGYTKFVGRRREMDAIKAAAERAKGGHGQMVAVMAEPGVGKSRLFSEFKAISQSGWMVLETVSISHGKASAYLPVLDLLQGYFKIASEDDERTRREKVAGKIAILDRSLEDTLPHLFSLLGIVEGGDPLAQMEGQIRKRRTLEAIKRIALRESLNQPLMVIFEDLHWIDEATQEFLNLLADSLGTAKILLLLNYRPEYSHKWNSKTYYTQLRLDPLGQASADEMLQSLMGDNAELAPLKRLIIDKTEGNPLFMEEIVQALFEDEALKRNGTVTLTRPLNQLKIPPTVQGILAARTDRLPANAKELLQTLAVIGREFSLSLIRAVVPKSDDELNRLLNDLQLGEFIYEQPAVGDTEYIFKHALTHDVAYNSVLIERRKALHEQVGEAIERLFADRLDHYVTELAHHYSHSDRIVKALEYQERAGRQAVQRSAYDEATRDFTTALELLPRLPQNAERDRRELALQTSLAPVLMATKGWAALETEKVWLHVYELAKTMGTPEQRFSSLVFWYGSAYVGGRLPVARERLKEVVDFIREHPDPVFVLETCHLEWSLALSYGELDVALHHVERGLALYEAQLRSIPVPLYTAHHPAVCGHGWGALAFWLRGFPDAAQRHANQAVSLAQDLQDSLSHAWALGTRAQVHQVMREVQPALEAAEAAIARAEGFPNVLLWARIVRGWALAEIGSAEEGVGQIREAIAAMSAGPGEMWRTYDLAQLAEACAKADRIGEGLATIAEALDLIHQNGERWWEAEIVRLRGELLLRQGDSKAAEAQSCFERAMQIAHKQEARSLELRATTSRARLLATQGKRDEARAMLAEIYNWFTEGFDTADLRDAKALLDELSISA
jgi:class 3 adenylate cyclase/predicted ATPase